MDKQSNEITVKEFKMWLEGVIEMQDDDWIPDARQWKKVLDKIYDIAENTQSPVKTRQFENEGHHVYGYSADANPLGASNYPSQPLQYAQSGLANAPAAPQHNADLFNSGTMPTRTPNIDTSIGYDTPFA